MDRINAYRASRQMPHRPGQWVVPTGHSASAPQAATLSGNGQLDKGCSVTLRAREASVLRITRGRVWLTFNPTLKEPSARLGDRFLGRGESVALAAGESAVMESYGPTDATLAVYSWEASAANSAVATFARPAWRDGWVLPMRDLRLALALTSGALGQLARNLTVGVVAKVIGVAVKLAANFLAERGRKQTTRRDFKRRTAETFVDCSGQ